MTFPKYLNLADFISEELEEVSSSTFLEKSCFPTFNMHSKS